MYTLKNHPLNIVSLAPKITKQANKRKQTAFPKWEVNGPPSST